MNEVVTVPAGPPDPGAYQSPQFLRYLQRIVQEAVLRHGGQAGEDPED